MGKFLNTSGTNYYLEELIKSSNQLLVIVSPFLKFNPRIKELIEERNLLRNVDIRIIYGKSELSPDETNWLSSLEMVRVSYCDNLHAKCYLNENAAIITSMNLYDFSQQNNNEMGILILKPTDETLYSETLKEVNRLIRISKPTKLIAEPQEKTSLPKLDNTSSHQYGEKLTTSKLAQSLDIPTRTLMKRLAEAGYLEVANTSTGYMMTDKAKKRGAEYRKNSHGKSYYLWPRDFRI